MKCFLRRIFWNILSKIIWKILRRIINRILKTLQGRGQKEDIEDSVLKDSE